MLSQRNQKQKATNYWCIIYLHDSLEKAKLEGQKKKIRSVSQGAIYEERLATQVAQVCKTAKIQKTI